MNYDFLPLLSLCRQDAIALQHDKWAAQLQDNAGNFTTVTVSKNNVVVKSLDVTVNNGTTIILNDPQDNDSQIELAVTSRSATKITAAIVEDRSTTSGAAVHTTSSFTIELKKPAGESGKSSGSKPHPVVPKLFNKLGKGK